MLNIALPKGRLGDQVLSLFSKIGYDCGGIYENDRRLVLESPENCPFQWYDRRSG